MTQTTCNPSEDICQDIQETASPRASRGWTAYQPGKLGRGTNSPGKMCELRQGGLVRAVVHNGRTLES